MAMESYRAPNRAINILELPEEILVMIFMCLKWRLRDLSNIAKTCRTFQRILQRPNFKIVDYVENGEHLKDNSLVEHVEEGNTQQDLALSFSKGSLRRPEWLWRKWPLNKWERKYNQWQNSISRNLERALPNLTFLTIFRCSINISQLQCLPRTLKSVVFDACTIVEETSATSMLFGLPYLTDKCKMFELTLSNWKDVGWQRVEIYSCFDQFMNPYGIRMWLYLEHNLKGDEPPWIWEDPNYDGCRFQRRFIQGIQILMRYSAEEQDSLQKYDVKLLRDFGTPKTLRVVFNQPISVDVKFWTRWRKNWSQPNINLKTEFLFPCLIFICDTFWLMYLYVWYLIKDDPPDEGIWMFVWWLCYCILFFVALAFYSLRVLSSMDFEDLTRTFQLGPLFCRRSVSRLWLERLTKIMGFLTICIYLLVFPYTIIY